MIAWRALLTPRRLRRWGYLAAAAGFGLAFAGALNLGVFAAAAQTSATCSLEVRAAPH